MFSAIAEIGLFMDKVPTIGNVLWLVFQALEKWHRTRHSVALNDLSMHRIILRAPKYSSGAPAEFLSCRTTSLRGAALRRVPLEAHVR